MVVGSANMGERGVKEKMFKYEEGGGHHFCSFRGGAFNFFKLRRGKNPSSLP
jgi:hypothetical protein